MITKKVIKNPSLLARLYIFLGRKEIPNWIKVENWKCIFEKGYWGASAKIYLKPFYINFGAGGGLPFIMCFRLKETFLYCRLRIPLTYLCVRITFYHKNASNLYENFDHYRGPVLTFQFNNDGRTAGVTEVFGWGEAKINRYEIYKYKHIVDGKKIRKMKKLIKRKL